MNEYRFRAYLKYEKKMVDVKVMDWDIEGNEYRRIGFRLKKE